MKDGRFESVLGNKRAASFRPHRATPWYRKDEDLDLLLNPEIERFYSEYAGIHPSSLKRTRAWLQGYWPSAGYFWFAQNIFCSHPLYFDLVTDLQNGAVLLDVGTGLGQDLRHLAHSGAPTENMIAVDSRLDLWKIGLSLFDDGNNRSNDILDGQNRIRISGRPEFKARFIEADLIHGTLFIQYTPLFNFVDIIVANNFFNNVVDWYTSKLLLDKLEPFTKPGTLFVGYHIAPEVTFQTEDLMYYHNHISLCDDIFRSRGLATSEKVEWEMLLCNIVNLQEWGLDEDTHLAWLKEEMKSHEPESYRWHGVYYAFKRMK